MALFDWDEKFDVSHDVLNKQHRGLADLINRLWDEVKSGRERAEISALFAELVNYTEQHFQFEEDLLILHQVPDLDTHQKEHERLRQQVIQLRARFDRDEFRVEIDTLMFLQKWLSAHILDLDRRYAPYLRQATTPSS